VKLLPKSRRGRLALAGGLLAALAAYWYGFEYRPWEDHFRGRPTSWWDRELAREWDGPTRPEGQPGWRERLARYGLATPAPGSPARALRAGDPAAAPVLAGLLESQDRRTRGLAVEELTALGEAARPAVPALLRRLRDRDTNFRWEAFRALKAIDPEALPAAAPALTAWLGEGGDGPNELVRGWAVDALGEMGPEAREAAPFLLGVLDDRDSLILHETARRALRRIDPGALAAHDREAVPALTALLASPAPSDRQAAAIDLGLTGARAWPAVPALLRLLGDPDGSVRWAAREAAARIDPGALAAHERARPGPPAPAAALPPAAPPLPGGERALAVRLLKGPDTIAAVRQSRRAVVFLDSPISVDARPAGEKFLMGVLLLRQYHPGLGADAFWVEDGFAGGWCEEWLASLCGAGLSSQALLSGRGAVLWLEYGEAVRFRPGLQIRSGGEVARAARELWAEGQ
jgi:hypothetical protein